MIENSDANAVTADLEPMDIKPFRFDGQLKPGRGGQMFYLRENARSWLLKIDE